MSRPTKELISKKNELFKSATKEASEEKSREAKILSREIKKAIKKDRNKYFNEDIDIRMDPALAWKRVNQYLGVQKNLSPTEIRIINSQGQPELVSDFS